MVGYVDGTQAAITHSGYFATRICVHNMLMYTCAYSIRTRATKASVYPQFGTEGWCLIQTHRRSFRAIESSNRAFKQVKTPAPVCTKYA